ncbi:MAG: hypothetical protein EDM79_20120 [Chloroflexi bacterium]|nr:MAG: hypothetical protein EDM79_20120 [Chloroflexota bacterium]
MSSQNNRAIPGYFKKTIPILLAFSAYAAFLFAPPPIEFTRVAYFRASFVVMGALVLFLFAVWRQRSRFWEAASLALTLIFFSLAIVYKWQVPVYDGNLIGGLLPWSDANSYFTCGYQVLINGKINSLCTHRPIFALFWAFLYRLTGMDLRISIAVLTAINALAVHFASVEIRRAYHSLSAAIFTVFGFIYYYIYAGAVLTENIGFALGTLSVACLVRGANQKDEKIFGLGMFLMSLGLNARAGAFFILPVLLIWFVLKFRDRRPAWVISTIGLCAICLPFVINFMFLKSLSQPGAVLFSNYAHTFYGLASGNKGWTQILIDHPGVPESDYPTLAIEKFKENPAMLLRGILGAYGDYFKPIGAFSYLAGPFSIPKTAIFWLAFGASLYAAWIRRKAGVFSLLLFGFAGIFLSVGLLPPIDADVRVYAATISMTNLIFAAGVVTFVGIPEKFSDSETREISYFQALLVPYALLLILSIAAGPWLVRSTLAHSKSLNPPVVCEQGQYGLAMVVEEFDSHDWQLRRNVSPQCQRG